MSSATVYPRDIEACHRLLRAKDTLVEQQNRQLEEQKAEIAKVKAERDLAFQLAFRKKVERYLADPQQFVLDFGDSPDVVDAAEGIADAVEEQQVAGHTRRKKARKPRNEQLPAHLPRYEVKLDVPEEQKNCPEHGERAFIGYDQLETLEIIPISLRVRVTLIPKYACPKFPECGIVAPPRPQGLV